MISGLWPPVILWPRRQFILIRPGGFISSSGRPPRQGRPVQGLARHTIRRVPAKQRLSRRRDDTHERPWPQFPEIQRPYLRAFRIHLGARYDGSAEQRRMPAGGWPSFHKHLSTFTSEYRPISEFPRQPDCPAGICRRYGRETATPPPNCKRSVRNSSRHTRRYRQGQCTRPFAVAGKIHAWRLAPGNIMFEGQKVRVVLDFDSIKLAPVRPTLPTVSCSSR